MKPPEIHRFVVGPLATNCYVLAAGGRAIVVDPGDEAHRLIQWLETRGLRPAGIVNTHAHFDHLLAVEPLRQRYRIPFYLHRDEIPVLRRQRRYLLDNFGLDPGEPPEPNQLLTDGQGLCLPADGPLQVVSQNSSHAEGFLICLEVVHTPGHSPGSVCYRGEGFAFVGDLIFQDSVGRADLRGSDPEALRRSLKRLLTTWPPDTVLYPGHGPETTLARECRHNPFLLQWFPDLCPGT